MVVGVLEQEGRGSRRQVRHQGENKRQPLRQERLQYNKLEIRSASLDGVFSRLNVRVVQTTIV